MFFKLKILFSEKDIFKIKCCALSDKKKGKLVNSIHFQFSVKRKFKKIFNK